MMVNSVLDDREAGALVRQAANVIEKHGWITGSYGNEQDGFCVMGALRKTVERVGDFYFYDVRETLLGWLRGNGYLDRLQGIEYWNDKVAASAEDVLATLRKAADDLDPQTWVKE